MKSNKKEIKKIKKPLVEKVGDVQRLVELLRINQIELEHQNQELRITQEELEVSRNKYVSLFDFSPVPYFSLDREGIIKEANIIASKMLGIDRNKLVGKRFITFIPPGERDVFNLFINTVFNSDVKNSCELNVMNKDKRIFHVRLEGLEIEDALQTDQKCQVALIEL
jgi:PAS domain S-box-containing protein